METKKTHIHACTHGLLWPDVLFVLSWPSCMAGWPILSSSHMLSQLCGQMVNLEPLEPTEHALSRHQNGNKEETHTCAYMLSLLCGKGMKVCQPHGLSATWPRGQQCGLSYPDKSKQKHTHPHTHTLWTHTLPLHTHLQIYTHTPVTRPLQGVLCLLVSECFECRLVDLKILQSKWGACM